MFNFITSARRASWFGGPRTFISRSVTELTFGNGYAESGRNGYVQNSTMVGGDTEDGGEDDYLHTHPASGRNGKIVGIFPEYRVLAGDRFTAKIGFNEGATGTDGATFVFGIILEGRSVDDANDFFSSESSRANVLRDNYVELHRATKRYDGTLRSVDVDLSGFSGQRVRFVLSVEAGLTSGQDWAIWGTPLVTKMAEITIRNLFCIAESTSGGNHRIQKRRRRRGSDEVAFMIMARGTNNRREFTTPLQFELRTLTSVDSGERKEFFEPVSFLIPTTPQTTDTLIWLQALEIDGTGSTSSLAQTALNTWSGYIFFHPNRDSGSDSAHYSISRAASSSNAHDVLFEDYWKVSLNDIHNGGTEAPTFDYAGRSTGGPSNMSTYLNEKGITRTINLNRYDDMSIETRRYRNSGEHSDYSFDVIYR